MGREAVAAAVDLGHGDRDALAGLGVQAAFAERAVEAEVAFEGRRAVGDDAE